MSRLIKHVARMFGKGPHSGADRRRHARVPVPEWTNLCFLDGSQEALGDGDVKDLSASGIRFLSDSKPSRGAKLKIKLHFPPKFGLRRPLLIGASVIRVSKASVEPFYEVACHFAGLDDSVREHLKSYIHWVNTYHR